MGSWCSGTAFIIGAGSTRWRKPRACQSRPLEVQVILTEYPGQAPQGGHQVTIPSTTAMGVRLEGRARFSFSARPRLRQFEDGTELLGATGARYLNFAAGDCRAGSPRAGAGRDRRRLVYNTQCRRSARWRSCTLRTGHPHPSPRSRAWPKWRLGFRPHYQVVVTRQAAGLRRSAIARLPGHPQEKPMSAGGGEMRKGVHVSDAASARIYTGAAGGQTQQGGGALRCDAGRRGSARTGRTARDHRIERSSEVVAGIAMAPTARTPRVSRMKAKIAGSRAAEAGGRSKRFMTLRPHPPRHRNLKRRCSRKASSLAGMIVFLPASETRWWRSSCCRSAS